MKPFCTYSTIGVIRYTDPLRSQDFVLHDGTEIYVTNVNVTGYNTRIEFRDDSNYGAAGYFDVRNEFYDILPDVSHMLKDVC